MAPMLLNPMVNSVFILLLAVFDTVDSIGFPETLFHSEGGLRLIDVSGSMAEEEKNWRVT